MGDEILIFQHIPKTGGITLSHLLLHHFERDEVFHVRNPEHTQAPIFGETWGTIEDFAALPVQDRLTFRCVMGHMQFGVHELLAGRGRYITILRDPVERILSQHGQYNRMVQNQEIASKQLLSLEEYLEQKPSALDNHQTRFLLGEKFHGRSDVERLEMVKNNFDHHFKLVGVLERFEETILVLNKLMGWPRVPYRRRNVGVYKASREELPPVFIDKIRKINHLDFQVHAYAKELLNKAIDSYGPKLEGDLTKLRRCNKKLERLPIHLRVYVLGVRLIKRLLGKRQ